MEKEDQDFEQLRKQLTEIINNNFDKFSNKRIFNLGLFFVGKPMPSEHAKNNRDLFERYYLNGHPDNKIADNKFLINKDEINKIIGENWTKDYFHVFFVNDKDNPNTLSLIFRFSDIETFNVSNIDNLDDDKAYRLLNGRIIPHTNTDTAFSQLQSEFENGNIGERIKKVLGIDTEITLYTTYEMSEVLLFRGFEEDITLELMCKLEGYNLRLGLQTYVKDQDRIHHKTAIGPVYEGYYDLGNLKP